MSMIVIGVNHQTAPVEMRERLSVNPSELAETLSRWREQLPVSELVLLSTCNRTELYAEADDVANARRAIEAVLSERASGALPSHALYHHEEGAGVKHLFRVAAGLDSLVLGEQEILGQVKQAYLHAQKGGFTGKLFNVLFQRSLYVGKRVRTETGLANGAGSVGSAAVALAEKIFSTLHDRSVLILGAGKMAELTARHLLSQKVASLFVANRTFERAQELAHQLGAQALSFEEGLSRFAQADIVICSTAAPHPIVEPAVVENAMQVRKGRSLFFIDIAVPRDVHPDVHALDNVYVYNIDDLKTIVQETMSRRSVEIRTAEKIIEDKALEFASWLAAHREGREAALKHDPAAETRLSATGRRDV